jgi:hypothetical protein
LHSILEKPYFEDALERFMDERGQKIHSTSIAEQFEEYQDSDRQERLEILCKNYPDDVEDCIWEQDKDIIPKMLARCDSKRLRKELESICEEQPELILSILMKQLNPSVVGILADMTEEKRKEQLYEIYETYCEQLAEIYTAKAKVVKKD